MGVELEVAGVFADEVDAAMDWLVGVTRRSGKRMAKHLSREPSRGWRRSNLSWSGITGRGCALAVCGYSHGRRNSTAADRRRRAHRPCRAPGGSVVYFRGPPSRSPFTDLIDVVRTKFGLIRPVLVGYRGMITSA
ncbi:hypothetical protein A4G26_28250 [Mycobacterium kansasii]|nr:hypothetical protein A4G26_28250 [Mycobacterium kansasii]